MEFRKDEEILDLASREAWSKFAHRIHSICRAAPCVLSRCKQLEHLGGRFEPNGRCRVIFKLPGMKHTMNNLEPGVFKCFPRISNGSKTIMPKYLDWIMYKVEKELPAGLKWDESENNHFSIYVGPDSVQILIYGTNCTFPFQIPSL